MAKHETIDADRPGELITDLAELAELLELPSILADQFPSDYPLCIPRDFVHRMKKGDPNDPILLQILPRKEELKTVAGFSGDPLGESVNCRSGRYTDRFVLRKYPGRILLLTTHRCALNCRFCFRRHGNSGPGLCESVSDAELQSLIATISQESKIDEIILSGGDPLMLTDAQIERLVHYIGKISSVKRLQAFDTDDAKKKSGRKRLRIHSRIPVVWPKRLTDRLVELLSSYGPLYLVLHVNHPNELCEDVFEALGRLRNVVILSQTVLLKGINDDEKILFRLFNDLADHGILPYYLHQLDKVQGAAHFEVEPDRGCQLIENLRNRLPGYAVPRYVCETIGELSKRLIR